MSLTPKTLLIVSFTVVSVAILALLGAVILKGGVTQNGTSIAALISFLGLLINGLLNVVVAASIDQKVNGHLAQHMEAQAGLDSEHIRSIIEDTVAKALAK